MNITRIESDSLGPIEVPADRLWGAQTQRSLEHFDISSEKMPEEIILALAEIKRGSGTAYDADVADACLRLFREKSYQLPA